MQLLQLERDDWNFFCPATGQPVFKETGEANAPTLRGSWCHEVPEEPLFVACPASTPLAYWRQSSWPV